MSCFLVDPATITVVVNSAATHQLIPNTRPAKEALGQLLWAQNAASLAARYNEPLATPTYHHPPIDTFNVDESISHLHDLWGDGDQPLGALTLLASNCAHTYGAAVSAILHLLTHRITSANNALKVNP